MNLAITANLLGQLIMVVTSLAMFGVALREVVQGQNGIYLGLALLGVAAAIERLAAIGFITSLIAPPHWAVTALGLMFGAASTWLHVAVLIYLAYKLWGDR